MSGKEKELATDPDCSTILERMAYSMDDFARRVFLDRLAGSYKTLAKHRFASHVCQTFLEVARDTIARESRGIYPSAPEESEGELGTMKELVLGVCEELLDSFPSLMLDPFASHVYRSLFTLLAPNLFPEDAKHSNVRSKKSAAYKARQGPMRSVFNSEGNEHSKASIAEFKHTSAKFVRIVREKLDANEVRALAASPVASPVLQMLLELEAGQGIADEPNSLTDRVLDGLVTKHHGSETIDASDYVGTLLRDPTSSHLLETLVSRIPDPLFNTTWETYLEGKLARIAVHPVANFVVAKALGRLSPMQLEKACEELGNVAEKIYKSSRTGVLRALLGRAAELQEHEAAAFRVTISGIGISPDSEDEKKLLVPCILRLLTPEEYAAAKNRTEKKAKEVDQNSNRTERPKRGQRHGQRQETSEDVLSPKTQGAVLLQTILTLQSPYNQPVLDSIHALPIDDLIQTAHDVTGSRVLDAVLNSSTVPFKDKRKFVMSFIGHYHELVDDRIGSRVGDNCWAFADPYLKEKIARSLSHYERALAGSFYGKFFARNLNLHLLQRDPEKWKTLQANTKTVAQGKPLPSAPQLPKSFEGPTNDVKDSAPTRIDAMAEKKEKGTKKRKSRPEDEIDQLFEAQLGKKVKKADLGPGIEQLGNNNKTTLAVTKERKNESKGKDLDVVLGAIKTAPKGDHDVVPRKKKTF